MSTSFFIEDIFVAFAKASFAYGEIDHKDSNAIESFYFTLVQGSQLTKLQSEFILRLLKKYRPLVCSIDSSYSTAIDNPVWKTAFRVLDTSKTAKIVEGTNRRPEIRLKFPYAFKSEFEKTFFALKSHKQWDAEQKENVISLYDVNLVALHEFLVNNRFNIDNSMLDALATVEEMWQNYEAIDPHCVIEDDQVVLKNAIEDAETYWKDHRTGQKDRDLLLAHSMSFRLKSQSTPATVFEKIAAEEHSAFWCREADTFFQVHRAAGGAAVIILDRSENIIDWLNNFVDAADRNNVSREDIKLCFRDDKNEGTKINDWIKANNVGGKVDNGKVFVFRHKPAKWLFTNQIPVTILGTNSLFPMTNLSTQKWVDSHNCVMYIGDIKASQIKGKNIVEL
jgi:hypothetical protein